MAAVLTNVQAREELGFSRQIALDGHFFSHGQVVGRDKLFRE
jgi:hypothetical protein